MLVTSKKNSWGITNYWNQSIKAVAWRCSVKKVFLEISQNSQENTSARVSFLIKLQAWAYNFIKSEALAQVFSFEFCEISKNTFSYRTPPLAAFESNFFSEDLPGDSRPDMFYKKSFSKKISKFTRKLSFWSSFLLRKIKSVQPGF